MLAMQISLLLLLSNFFFWPSPVDWQMIQNNVVVRGTVVDESSGDPIADAAVYAISAADVERTTSDSRGNFFFLTLFPGIYSLCGSKHGYAIDCTPRNAEPERLSAGFEYGATVILSRATE
jgi:hypothetical protein